MTDEERALRADARLNEDRILRAAAEVFQLPDADTSMKAIAQRAGVGIGTLYRRFPTREQLVEAVYRSETKRLANSASRYLKSNTPEEALRKWINGFLDYMLAKDAMAEALPVILAKRNGLRLESRDLLRDAIAQLLRAPGSTLRADIAPDDVMMAIGGIALISGHESDRRLATRLTRLLIDGLTAAPHHPGDTADRDLAAG